MFRARRIPFLLPAGLILALGASGCGGGKQQVSAAELVQKGDAICRDELSKFREIQTEPPANASEAADQTKDLINAAEDANSSLDDLEPPDALQGTYGSYLDARDRAVDQMKRGQGAAENQDSNAYGAAQAAVVHTQPQRRKLAASLGLQTCSANPGSV
jgi:hypothetical protein